MRPKSVPLAYTILILTILTLGSTLDQASAAPIPFILHGEALMKTRMRVSKGDPSLARAIKWLRRSADEKMHGKMWNVTEKPFPPPDGDYHNYFSLSSYYWPNPNSPSGLPYIARDGQLNPEVHKYDRDRLDGMVNAVYTLSLAYYLTGEAAYGQRAADQLRVWFLNPDTKMNPNLQYAQRIPGGKNSSRNGIIETEILTQVVDAEALLTGSPAWTERDHKRLQEWFTQYLAWILTAGEYEGGFPNNRGSSFDLQVADFALFIGQNGLARRIVREARIKRIAKQIEPDGSQPYELKRTKAWGYSQSNLTALFELAQLGERLGIDLWHYQTKDGRSIRRALDWLLPYAVGKKNWQYKQITKWNSNKMVYLLLQASIVYKEPAYAKAIGQVKGVSENSILHGELLYPQKEPNTH